MTWDKMETYHGYVRTPADAIKLFEACRRGLLPRVQRRLSEKERQSIRSGSVFVWDEEEAGMRRWTDGKSWSASRVSGSFLTYREMEGKRGGGFSSGRRALGKTPESSRGSDEDHDDGEPDGYRYKLDGLMKQSFSIVTQDNHRLHLISYYSRYHGEQPELPQPTADNALSGVIPPKGMYPESSSSDLHHTPALIRTPMPHAYASDYTHGYPSPYTPLWPTRRGSSQAHASLHAHSASSCNLGHFSPRSPPQLDYSTHVLPPLIQPQAPPPPYRASLSPPEHPPVFRDRKGSHGPLPLPGVQVVTSPPVQHPGMTPPRGPHDSFHPSGDHRPRLTRILADDAAPMEPVRTVDSPPRTDAVLVDKYGSEDHRALRILDRKFW